ncbi:MAG: endonuclease MutS2 [Fimbriimonadaceae bacterium]|nr:endonuclease MutS2 [Fimbriimonadaceae bacterium]
MHALQVLEYDAIRERLAAKAETEMAARRASEMLPAFEERVVWERLEETSEATKLLEATHPPSLYGVHDLRPALNRCRKGGDLGAVEIYRCGEALRCFRELRSYLKPRKETSARLWARAENLPELPHLGRKIAQSVDSDGQVLDGASPRLGDLRRKMRTAASRIVERIQSYVSRHRDLLSDPIYTMRDGRYVIPVKSENRGKIPGLVHDTSGSGQTLFVEPEAVVQLGNALREAEAAERDEVRRILAELSKEVAVAALELEGGVAAVGEIDFLFARARLGFDLRGAVPDRGDGCFLEIEGGRHPLLDPAIAVPLEIAIGRTRPCVLITGPNTGGKTVSIKTVGLFALMLQSGLFVPARHVRFGPFTQVWADIGDEQSLTQSLSTFSGHIRNIAAAIKELKPGALVLLDEIGAGTDPAEGAALAKAILTHLRDGGARVLASTHYGELKAFAYDAEGFANAAMEFDLKTLQPTYRLLMGSPGASHALKIAERYGIPKELVEHAKSGLSTDERAVTRMLEELELAQRQARKAQGEADRLAARLKDLERDVESKLEEAREAKRRASEVAKQTVENHLRDMRLEATRIFDSLKSSADGKALQKAREDFKALQGLGQHVVEEFEERTPARAGGAKPLEKGDRVMVEGYGKVGVLLENPEGRTTQVQIGSLKVNAPVSKLRAVEGPGPVAESPRRPNAGLARAMGASTEISLRGMRAEDAMELLQRFLDDAVLGHLDRVRIVHGKGEGILRNLTRETLRKHPSVRSYRDGEPTEGGHGVTVATLG